MTALTKFNVIIFNPNSKEFEEYDVIPYLAYEFKKEKKKPQSFEEFDKFVDRKLQYQYWSRCEYEIILKDWPCEKVEKKIDIYWQCRLNMKLISLIFYNYLIANKIKINF